MDPTQSPPKNMVASSSKPAGMSSMVEASEVGTSGGSVAQLKAPKTPEMKRTASKRIFISSRHQALFAPKGAIFPDTPEKEEREQATMDGEATASAKRKDTADDQPAGSLPKKIKSRKRGISF